VLIGSELGLGLGLGLG